MQSKSGSFGRSSAGYATELVPGRRLRFLLLACAAAAIIAGTVLILLLPVLPLLRFLTALLWIASGLAELSSFRRGMARVERIVISADGSVHGRDASGRVCGLRVLPGSLVLDRVAWLRLGFEDGLAYGEVLAGSSRESDAWRRLRVLWRHGCAFGRPGRS